jgi:putative protein-disulfide isomerase
MTGRLVYAFDPLCGWCYGFGPTMRAVRAALPDLPVDLRFGGLVTDGRIGRYADMRAYIETAQVRLRKVTGLAPGPDFHARILRNPAVIASSIPPCDVLLQVRTATPCAVPDFAEALQTAHFRDGADYNDPGLYDRITTRLGLDIAPDLPLPNDLRPALAAEFNATRCLGVASYPSLFLQTADAILPVDLHYRAEEQVKAVKAKLAAVRA